jgi:hypothetical protein
MTPSTSRAHFSCAISVLALSLLLLVAMGSWTSAEGHTRRVPGSDRCQGVNVRADAPLASVVNRHGAATTYCLARGNYTVTERVLLDPGDRVVGAGRDATIIQAASGIGVMFGYYHSDATGLVTFKRLSVGGANRPRDEDCNSSCGAVILADVRIHAIGVRCFGNGTTCFGGFAHDIVVRNFECDGNGWHPDSLKTDFQSASCIKLTRGSFTMTNSNVHDNYWDGIRCDHCDHVAFVIRDSTLVNNGRSGIVWEVSGDAVEGDHSLITNNKIRNNGWNTDGPASGWAGIIISDSSNIEIVGNTFGGNDAGDDSGGRRAIFIYDGTRNPLPMHDIYIHDNVLNGDRIRSCTITGVTCD